MSRIPTPASIEATPAESQPLLAAVKQQLGVVPNLFRLVATSPAALAGYIQAHAIAKVVLPVVVLQQLAVLHEDRPEVLRSLREITTTGEQMHLTGPVIALLRRLPVSRQLLLWIGPLLYAVAKKVDNPLYPNPSYPSATSVGEKIAVGVTN